MPFGPKSNEKWESLLQARASFISLRDRLWDQSWRLGFLLIQGNEHDGDIQLRFIQQYRALVLSELVIESKPREYVHRQCFYPLQRSRYGGPATEIQESEGSRSVVVTKKQYIPLKVAFERFLDITLLAVYATDLIDDNWLSDETRMEVDSRRRLRALFEFN